MMRLAVLGMIAAGCLTAQVLVEYGVAAANSAKSTAKLAEAGKDAAKIMNKTANALAQAAGSGQAATQPVQTEVVRVATPVAPARAALPQAPPAATLDGAADIPEGMERSELVGKYGKPSMSLSSLENGVLVEKAWYRSGEGTLLLTLRDGKVAGVTKEQP